MTYENFKQAEPVLYTTLQKEWRAQKGNHQKYHQWQMSVFGDYADLLMVLTQRRHDGDYLSPEERSDFIHCYNLMLQHRVLYKLPYPERMEVDELYNKLAYH